MIFENFKSNLELMIAGDKSICSKPLLIGTPSNDLLLYELDNNKPITITKKVIDKAMAPEIRDSKGRLKGSTGHELSIEELTNAIYALERPPMVFKREENNSLIVLSEVKDKKERLIIVVIEINRTEAFSKVNSIRSIYGRDNLEFFIENNFKEGNLVGLNKEKTDEMLRSIGKSYPKENTFISL